MSSAALGCTSEGLPRPNGDGEATTEPAHLSSLPQSAQGLGQGRATLTLQGSHVVHAPRGFLLLQCCYDRTALQGRGPMVSSPGQRAQESKAAQGCDYLCVRLPAHVCTCVPRMRVPARVSTCVHLCVRVPERSRG